MNGYYADRDVRARLREYSGAGAGSGPTAVYAACLEPARRGADARWELAVPAPIDRLDALAATGGDVARSLWDDAHLLFHLDLDYQNTDAEGEPFLYPAEAFFRLEPVYRAIRREMLRFGLPLFVLMTGRGYHFTGQIRLDDPLVGALAALVPATPRWINGVARRAPAGAGTGLTATHARAHAGMALLVEYFSQRVLRRVGLDATMPVVFNGTVVGAGVTGRAAASIDFSHYGDPLDVRLMRMAFSLYQLHRMRPDMFGERASRVDALAAVPRPRGLEEALLSRTPARAREMAAHTRAHLPDVHAGLTRLLEEYRGSRLAVFHRGYAEAVEDPAAPPRAVNLGALPGCIAWPLREPNDRLLQPAFLQQVTRALVAEGWHPAEIASLVFRAYAADHHWGAHWARRDPWTRAVFDVGVFAALIHGGLDEGIDFNCVSAHEKGICPGGGCRFNLADVRDKMLSRA